MTKRRARPEPEERAIEIGPRALLTAAAAVVLLVVAGAWWLGRRGGGTSPAAVVQTGSSVGAPAGVGGAGYEGDPEIGSTTAPVTIFVYSDFQCPNCHQFATVVLPWLRTTWIPQGVVRVVMRDFAARGEDSVAAAAAAHCAGEQGGYWKYYDVLFRRFGEGSAGYTEEALVENAVEAGLNAESLRDCIRSGRFRGLVEASTQSAQSQGFGGTPTYLINGRQVEGAIEVARWDELFKAYETDLGLVTAPAGGG